MSSYQGGHNEFFRYMVDRLKESARATSGYSAVEAARSAEEIAELMDYGVERIYHPHDGMEMGLEAMIKDLVDRTGRRAPRDGCRGCPRARSRRSRCGDDFRDRGRPARRSDARKARKEWQVKASNAPVVGITGTGGAGKSSVTDEILNRFLAVVPGHEHRSARGRPNAAPHRRSAAR